MIALAALLLVALSAHALGRGLLSRLGGPSASAGVEGATLAIGSGLGLLSLLVTALAAFTPFLKGAGPWILLGGLGSAGGWIVFRKAQTVKSFGGLYPVGLVAGTSAVVVFYAAELPLLFMPSVDGDVIGYHFRLPQLFVQDGRLSNHPEILYNFWPLHGEMLFTLALGTGGEAAARGVCWLVSATWALAFTSFVSRTSSPRTAVLAVLLVLAIPQFHHQTTLGMVDVFVIFYAQLALGAVERWRETAAPATPDGDGRTRGWILLAGLFAGFATAAKWTGGLVPILLAGLILADRRAGGTAFRLRALSGFAAAALAGPMPWWIRNAVLAGNPVWPWFFDLFGGRYLSPDHARLIWDFHRREFGATGSSGLGGLVETVPYLLHDATPFLVLVPLALLPLRGGLSAVRRLAALALSGFLLWHFVSPQFRFLMPLLPWALAAAAHLMRIALARWGRVAFPLLLAVPAFAGYRWWKHCVPDLREAREVLGRGDRESFLSRQNSIRGWRDIPALRTATSPADLILLENAPIGYYLPERRTIPHGNVVQPLLDYTRIRTPEELRDRLRAIGVTHIYIQRDEASNYIIRRMKDDSVYLDHTLRSSRVFTGMIDRWSEPVFASGHNRLVRLR